MGASVRIEDEAFADRRYERLAKAAGLADADHARGKMAVIWRQCTIEQRYLLDIEDVIDVLGERGVDALVDARLGERVGDLVRICGAKGRIEWLAKLRKNGRKGGRPRKTKREPSGFESSNPPAPAPAPAPAPVKEEKQSAPHSWPAAIASVADLEEAVAAWGWGVTGLGQRERARASRLIEAAPIARHEYAMASAKTQSKDIDASKRVAYFLGVVEGNRKDAAEEAAKPRGPGAAPDPDDEGPLPIYLRQKWSEELKKMVPR